MNDLQKCILNIFKCVAELCDKHNIIYFADSGTCLGAVRHHGFIPWDDDMDISIPIEYCDKFIEIAKKELPSYLQVYTCKEIEGYPNIFFKVVDLRTTFIEESQYDFPKAYKGVFLDIVPAFGVPDSKLGFFVFSWKLWILQECNAFHRIPINKSMSTKARIARKFFHMLNCKHDFTYFSDKYWKIMQKYPFFKADRITYAWFYGRRKDRLVLSKEIFGKGIPIKFEDININCPLKWDIYLTEIFQNYMTPPPISQRIAKHSGIVDLHISFLRYQEHPELIRKRLK